MSRFEKLTAAAVILGGVAIMVGGGMWIRRDPTLTTRRPATPPPDSVDGPRVERDGAQTPGKGIDPEGRTGQLTGRVLDAGQSGVADAGVTALTFDGRPRLAAEARTDRDGSFFMEKLAPGRYTLRASREGVGSAHREMVEVQADRVTSIEPLVLARGASVEIDVALAGVTLTLYGEFRKTERVRYPVLLLETRSGTDGKIALTGLDDGTYRYKLSKPGYAIVNDSFEVRNGKAAGPIRKELTKTP